MTISGGGMGVRARGTGLAYLDLSGLAGLAACPGLSVPFPGTDRAPSSGHDVRVYVCVCSNGRDAICDDFMDQE